MTEFTATPRHALDPVQHHEAAIKPVAVGIGQRNIRLQYLRGAAALAVVLFHSAEYLFVFRGEPRLLSVFGGFWGSYGVAVFFALSGYLMAEVLQRDEPARFLANRIARIYPLMLLLVGLFSLAFLLIGKPRGVNILALTLIPTGPRSYFLGVEWTLLYEMTYYTALATFGFVGLARFRSAAMVAWLVVLGIAYVAGPGRSAQSVPMLSEIPLSIINLPFVLGYLASGAHKRGWLPPFLVVPAAILAVSVALVAQEHSRLLVGLSAGLLVAAAVRAPAPAGHGWLDRFGQRLGDASYALYLCHVPIFLLAAVLLGAAIPTSLFWLLLVGAAIGFSLLLGPVDLLMHRRLKRWLDALPQQRLKAAGLAFLAAFIGIAAYTEYDARADAAQLANAEHILHKPSVVAGPEVRTAIEAAEQLPNGVWLVRGYGIDLDRPKLAAHFAIRQGRTIIAITAMTRMRVAVARSLGRPDIESMRFGFSLFLPKDLDCAKGPLEGVLVLEDGRPVVIAPGPLSRICN